jgi:hypothetical protein
MKVSRRIGRFIRVYYSPQLIHRMRAVLDAVMAQVPMSHATPDLRRILLKSPARCCAGRDKLRWLGSRGIRPDSNDYLDAHLTEKAVRNC